MMMPAVILAIQDEPDRTYMEWVFQTYHRLMYYYISVVQNLHRLFLIAIPGRPSLQLSLDATTEFQPLFPVFLKEVEAPCNGSILLPLPLTKGPAAHMDAKAAGVAR